ncbi:MAG TPA: ABC transporter substrate-binding protein [Crinalium sp.]
MKKVAIALGFAGFISSILLSCTSGNNQQANTQSPGQAGNSSSGALKGVGVTVGDLGNPFFVQIGHGAEAKAKQIGGDGTRVTVVSSGYDLNQQINQMENFVSSGANLILLNAADSKGIAPAVIQAKQAGATVIAVDVAAEGGVDATVTSNNVQAGELACQYIVDRLNGQGNVVIINGPPVSAVADRVKGCQSVFSKNPNIKVLSSDQNAEGSREGGLRVMSDLLTSFQKIDAVFAINDPTGIGADLAAKQAQRKEFFIVGVDGAPEAVQVMKQEGTLFVATAAQDPFRMAERAVEVGVDIINGNPPPDKTVLVPVQLVTRDNVDQYKGWTK